MSSGTPRLPLMLSTLNHLNHSSEVYFDKNGPAERQ